MNLSKEWPVHFWCLNAAVVVTIAHESIVLCLAHVLNFSRIFLGCTEVTPTKVMMFASSEDEASFKALTTLIPVEHLDADEPLRNISCSGAAVEWCGGVPKQSLIHSLSMVAMVRLNEELRR